MTEKDFLAQMKQAGDALITFRSAVSKKMKYHMGTLDLTTKYITKNPKPKTYKNNKRILIWAWDVDAYKFIDPKSVVEIRPLSTILNNEH